MTGGLVIEYLIAGKADGRRITPVESNPLKVGKRTFERMR